MGGSQEFRREQRDVKESSMSRGARDAETPHARHTPRRNVPIARMTPCNHDTNHKAKWVPSALPGARLEQRVLRCAVGRCDHRPEVGGRTDQLHSGVEVGRTNQLRAGRRPVAPQQQIRSERRPASEGWHSVLVRHAATWIHGRGRSYQPSGSLGTVRRTTDFLHVS